MQSSVPRIRGSGEESVGGKGMGRSGDDQSTGRPRSAETYRRVKKGMERGWPGREMRETAGKESASASGES